MISHSKHWLGQPKAWEAFICQTKQKFKKGKLIKNLMGFSGNLTTPVEGHFLGHFGHFLSRLVTSVTKVKRETWFSASSVNSGRSQGEVWDREVPRKIKNWGFSFDQTKKGFWDIWKNKGKIFWLSFNSGFSLDHTKKGFWGICKNK